MQNKVVNLSGKNRMTKNYFVPVLTNIHQYNVAFYKLNHIITYLQSVFQGYDLKLYKNEIENI